MSTIMELTRRSFLKAAGVATAVAVTGFNFVTTASAAAVDFVGKRQVSVY